MSLKAFHIFFISVSLVLSVGLLVWGVQGYRHSGDPGSLGLAGVGLVTMGLLVPYFIWFRKKMKTLTVLLLSFFPLAYPFAASACPVCFGDPNALMTKGMKLGILFLIVVVGGVLAAILGIGLSWARRAKAIRET